jgi:hypothetical protein
VDPITGADQPIASASSTLPRPMRSSNIRKTNA